jgi:hypothetical protein
MIELRPGATATEAADDSHSLHHHDDAADAGDEAGDPGQHVDSVVPMEVAPPVRYSLGGRRGMGASCPGLPVFLHSARDGQARDIPPPRTPPMPPAPSPPVNRERRRQQQPQPPPQPPMPFGGPPRPFMEPGPMMPMMGGPMMGPPMMGPPMMGGECGLPWLAGRVPGLKLTLLASGPMPFHDMGPPMGPDFMGPGMGPMMGGPGPMGMGMGMGMMDMPMDMGMGMGMDLDLDFPLDGSCNLPIHPGHGGLLSRQEFLAWQNMKLRQVRSRPSSL